MFRFQDDDDGYARWLSAHQVADAFVLNAERRPGPSYLVLHRATCYTISGDPARGQHWTHDPIKICGDRAELEVFAGSIGGATQPCGHCL